MGFCHNCGAEAGWIDGNPLCQICTYKKGEADRKRREQELEAARRKNQQPTQPRPQNETGFNWGWFFLAGLPTYLFLSTNLAFETLPSASLAVFLGIYFAKYGKQFFKFVFALIGLVLFVIVTYAILTN